MAAAPPGRRGPAPPSTKAAADDEATAPDLHRLTQWLGSEKPRHLPIVLHPRLSRPLPPPPRPARPATFWDVPQDVLRLVAAELAAHGSARDMCAFEGVCVATRSAVDDAAWTTLVSRSFPNARLPGSSADAAPPRKSCVPPTSTPTPLPSTAAAAAAAAPTWKRLYQFHHTLLYRCLVKGPPPRGGRPAMIRLAPGALFVALPLAVS